MKLHCLQSDTAGYSSNTANILISFKHDRCFFVTRRSKHFCGQYGAAFREQYSGDKVQGHAYRSQSLHYRLFHKLDTNYHYQYVYMSAFDHTACNVSISNANKIVLRKWTCWVRQFDECLWFKIWNNLLPPVTELLIKAQNVYPCTKKLTKKTKNFTKRITQQNKTK